YHLPADEQHLAFQELARTLSPDARAAIVYVWSNPPLVAPLSAIMEVIARDEGGDPPTGDADHPMEHPPLYYPAHSLEWFRARTWPFDYELRSFRLIGNEVMKQYFRDTPIWHSVVTTLLHMQDQFPELCGKYGQYPLIVVRPRR